MMSCLCVTLLCPASLPRDISQFAKVPERPTPQHPLTHTRPLTSPLSVRCDTTAWHLAEAMGLHVLVTATNHQRSHLCVCDWTKRGSCVGSDVLACSNVCTILIYGIWVHWQYVWVWLMLAHMCVGCKIDLTSVSRDRTIWELFSDDKLFCAAGFTHVRLHKHTQKLSILTHCTDGPDGVTRTHTYTRTS